MNTMIVLVVGWGLLGYFFVRCQKQTKIIEEMQKGIDLLKKERARLYAEMLSEPKELSEETKKLFETPKSEDSAE